MKKISQHSSGTGIDYVPALAVLT